MLCSSEAVVCLNTIEGPYIGNCNQGISMMEQIGGGKERERERKMATATLKG
jgi:hypothetical protein